MTAQHQNRPRLALGLAVLISGLALCGCAGSPGSSTSDPEHAVRAALVAWQADFNTRRDERICDLFASDLRYDYGSFPERGYDAICTLLHRSLSDPKRRYHYDLKIEEILIAGDLAIVRLSWTLEVADRLTGRAIATSIEPGMDIFRRQPDGSWKIIRYIAYEREA